MKASRFTSATATALTAALVSTIALPLASARPPKPPRWKTVSITVTCPDTEPALCRGNYGLTISADGSYTVGPEPGGQTISDKLTAEELATIAKTADALARTSSRAKPKCDKRPAAPGASQTVTLTTAADRTFTIFQASIEGKGSRCTVGNRAKVIELETTLGLLLALHYPLPFPS